MNKLFVISALCLLLIGCVSAISADYYFHPNCGHCEKIKPFIEILSSNNKISWVDTSEQKSYPIDGTPTLIIYATDGRVVKLTGSYEIPRYAQCELNEQSTKDCMTYSYLNCTTNSYFVR